MKYQPIPDYHMHTPRCNHAVGEVREYADMAIRLGLKEIGMSDHSPMPDGFDAAWRMAAEELPDYLMEVEGVRDELVSKLSVRVGLEADFHPGTEEAVQAMIDGYAWDYVMGSVHYIGDWAFDNPDEEKHWQHVNVEDAYCDYFDLVARSAATGMFDIIGHPDLIKKFGQRAPKNSKRVDHAESLMLEAVQASNTVLEISSAGLRKPVGEIYPHTRIVKKAAAMGIAFCFGSDAHAPVEVGYGMDACLDILQSCGVHEVVAFEQRQRRMIAIRQVG
ncbi:MAG: histidinol-phosphatase HisJ family protein [Mariprofundaceae bacterium]|nr:histidinol-phosphatase HisJ family protein [Mariprofundaceae bacterium]